MTNYIVLIPSPKQVGVSPDIVTPLPITSTEYCPISFNSHITCHGPCQFVWNVTLVLCHIALVRNHLPSQKSVFFLAYFTLSAFPLSQLCVQDVIIVLHRSQYGGFSAKQVCREHWRQTGGVIRLHNLNYDWYYLQTKLTSIVECSVPRGTSSASQPLALGLVRKFTNITGHWPTDWRLWCHVWDKDPCFSKITYMVTECKY